MSSSSRCETRCSQSLRGMPCVISHGLQCAASSLQASQSSDMHADAFLHHLYPECHYRIGGHHAGTMYLPSSLLEMHVVGPSFRIWALQGFYVNVDYHSNKHTDEIAHGDGSIYNQEAWTATWVQLIETILRNTPSAQGKLLLDLINEPDGCVLAFCLSVYNVVGI